MVATLRHAAEHGAHLSQGWCIHIGAALHVRLSTSHGPQINAPHLKQGVHILQVCFLNLC